MASRMGSRALVRHLAAHGTAVPHPPSAWMAAELPRLLEQWGAFGAYVGMRQRKGHWTKEVCLVVVTESKHEPSRRAGAVKKVPKSVRWVDRRMGHRLPTDVQEVTPQVQLHQGEVFGPGDGISIAGRVASVGAAVHHPQAGACLTTAGHLFSGLDPQQGGTVLSAGHAVPIAPVEIRQQATLDYAIVAPAPGFDCDNLFQDRFRIGPVFNATPADVGTPLMLLDSAGTATGTTCRGVGGQFATALGTFLQTIQTDPIGLPTQSGGALIDHSQRLWGFLIGTLGGRLSLYAPAQLILDTAGVQFIRG